MAHTCNPSIQGFRWEGTWATECKLVSATLSSPKVGCDVLMCLFCPETWFLRVALDVMEHSIDQVVLELRVPACLCLPVVGLKVCTATSDIQK